MTSKLMYRSHLGDLRSAKRLGKTTANVYITREIVCRFWIAQWRRQFEAFVKGLQSVNTWILEHMHSILDGRGGDSKDFMRNLVRF